MNLILILVFLITLFNAAMLLLNYYFVNRNWEKLIEQGNQLRGINDRAHLNEQRVDRITRKLDC